MTPLTSAEGLAGVVFLGFVATTAIGAIIATNSRHLIRAVAGLAVCFVGVAGIYYFLFAPFVALMQLLIYAGAVCVTIVFAIMLAEPYELERNAKVHPLAGPASILSAGVLTWGISALGLTARWKPLGERVNQGTVADVGTSMLSTYSMSFELISVILLVAIIGALVLARAGRDK